MQNSRNILTNTIIYFLGCLLSVIILVILDTIFGLKLFDPRTFGETTKYLFLPLIISIFIGYVITIATYTSQTKYIILTIFLSIIILLTLATVYLINTCKGLECIMAGYTYLPLLIVLVPFSATLPVYFQEFPIPVSLIFVIITTSLIYTIASFKMITAQVAQKAEVKKEQAIIKNSNVPKYDTNYGALSTKNIIYEKAENKSSISQSTQPTDGSYKWLYDNGGFIYYQRYYKSESQEFYLYLNEFKPEKNYSDNEMFNNDLAELKRYQQTYNSNRNDKLELETTKIGSYPGVLMLQPFNDPQLRIYRQGLIIELRVSIVPRGSYPKEELVKIGESLKLTSN